MSELTKRFQDIMKDIENNIKDEKELEYINKKITEVSMLHMEVIDEMTGIIRTRLDNIERVQNSIETKVNKMQTSITGIENDMYDDGFDFEIVCPYCNTEFTADIESKTDIRCPECQNVIELDWNGEDSSGCSGHCSMCNSKCGEPFFNAFGQDFDYTDEIEDDDDDDDDDM